MDKDGTWPPRSLPLELVQQPPAAVLVFDAACEGDEYGPAWQFLAKLIYFKHHLSRIAGAANEDHRPITPIGLHRKGITFSKF